MMVYVLQIYLAAALAWLSTNTVSPKLLSHMLGVIATLDHPMMVGGNPEVTHAHMAGLNFMHGVAQAWEAGKLFHIDLNDQYPGLYDQELRFGSRDLKAHFFDRIAIASRSLQYERLDQLTVEVRLGTRR